MSRMTLTLPPTLVFAAALAAAGCTTAGPAPSLTQAEIPLQGCALGVPGAVAIAEDTPEGMTLSFVSRDKRELRQRANDAAAQHGPGQRLGLGHEGAHGRGGDHGLQMRQAPAAKAVASEIEQGARITFAAAAPKDRELLRTKLRERASAMNALECK